MIIQHLILAFLWIIFCVLHSVFADSRVKKNFNKLLGRYFVYYRLFYTIFAFLTFGIILFYQFSIFSPLLFSQHSLTTIAGVIIAGSGLIIMIICIKKYFLSLSGLMSLFNTPKAKQELLVNGIHHFLRHPLYLGTFLFIWGLWMIYPYWSLMIANTIITIYTLIGIGFEEKKLEEEYGEPYRNYKKTVPRLIPFFIRRKQ